MRLLLILPILLIISIPVVASPYGFTYLKLDGTESDMQSYSGSYLVVELFSTECSHCIDYHPILAEVYPNYEAQIELISLSIDSDDTLDKISDFINDHPTTWEVGKTEASIASTYLR
ncbi:MAG: TlpA family protein disulfide reductase [Candidatus Kariarchaeaceae archaeon]|jgi:thiol-disulfide isomerase/thioredoxin